MVALSVLPVAGPFASVARLAHLLRVTRIVSAMPDLRLIVATMLRSIPSMGHVILLLGLLLYVYGVLGVNLFAEVDPAHWGSLGTALLTLFQMLTLEGWVEILGAVLPARPFAWLFFSSFIVVAVFVVINLFVAVVINNLERATAAEELLRDATSFFASGHRLDRWEGGLFLAYCVTYTTYLVLASTAHDALPSLSLVMAEFVLPLTAVTLAVVAWRVARPPTSSRAGRRKVASEEGRRLLVPLGRRPHRIATAAGTQRRPASRGPRRHPDRDDDAARIPDDPRRLRVRDRSQPTALARRRLRDRGDRRGLPVDLLQPLLPAGADAAGSAR